MFSQDAIVDKEQTMRNENEIGYTIAGHIRDIKFQNHLTSV